MSDQVVIKLTEAAEKKIGILMQATDKENKYLRIFIAGAGCSGFHYGFNYEKDRDDNDADVLVLKETDGGKIDLPLLLSKPNAPFLKNTLIDFQEAEAGSKFIVNNPNEESKNCGSCSGCGE